MKTKIGVSGSVIGLGSVKQQLQKFMWEKVGIVRTMVGLESARQHIIQWQKDYPASETLSPAWCELRNMLLTSCLVVEAALKRKKSLGAHFIERS